MVIQPQAAADTPVNSNSSSGNSGVYVHQSVSDGTDSGHVESQYTGHNLYSGDFINKS